MVVAVLLCVEAVIVRACLLVVTIVAIRSWSYHSCGEGRNDDFDLPRTVGVGIGLRDLPLGLLSNPSYLSKKTTSSREIYR